VVEQVPQADGQEAGAWKDVADAAARSAAHCSIAGRPPVVATETGRGSIMALLDVFLGCSPRHRSISFCEA
jgi:hypothetical protein